MEIFYSTLAPYWPLLSPVEDYREEALELLGILERAHPAARTLLELGSGGGHVAAHLKGRYALTLSDLSAAMLASSARLNPECEHVQGDMRTLDLGRRFDLVLAHDAIDYMTSEADLAAAMATAFRHCRPGGVVLLVPDAVKERFEPGTGCGGTDDAGGLGLRYLEWTLDPDPTDAVGVTHYAFLVREPGGAVRTLGETHAFGLFPAERWRGLLEAAGFAVEVLEERTAEARRPRLLFLGRRAA